MTVRAPHGQALTGSTSKETRTHLIRFPRIPHPSHPLVNTAPTPLLTTKVTMVKVVGTKAEFDEILASAGDKAVVVDFYATWCGPCKVIAPYYEELSKQFTNVVFIKVGMEGRKEGEREKCKLEVMRGQKE